MSKTERERLYENVYRTRDYIVKQELYLIVDAEQNNAVLSVDTYYRRTLVRDSKYQLLYKTASTSTASVFRRTLTSVCTSTDRGVTERKEHQGETYAVLRRIRVATHCKTSHRTAVRKIKRSLPYYNLIAGLPA